MATYRYTTLTDDVQHNIKGACYSREELADIYRGLKEKADAGRRKMKVVLIVLVIFYFCMIIPALKDVFALGEASILSAFAGALVPLPFLALGYALARWQMYGMFCSQFNRAVKKGYPNLAEEFKL